jgi:1,4-alpha-glucan branching enzyme
LEVANKLFCGIILKAVKKSGGVYMKSQSKEKGVKKKTAVASARKVTGPKKKFNRSKTLCKVSFTLPKEAAPEARGVHIVGDFNNWDESANPMKKERNGDFTAMVEMDCGREYRFRYLIDGQRWENDWMADRYEPNAFGGEDSVLILIAD